MGKDSSDFSPHTPFLQIQETISRQGKCCRGWSKHLQFPLSHKNPFRYKFANSSFTSKLWSPPVQSRTYLPAKNMSVFSYSSSLSHQLPCFCLTLTALFLSLPLKILPVYQHCDISCLQKIPLSCQGIQLCLVFCNVTRVLLNTELNTFFFKKRKDELK